MFNDSLRWIKTVLALSLQRADANRIYSNNEVDYLKILYIAVLKVSHKVLFSLAFRCIKAVFAEISKLVN